MSLSAIVAPHLPFLRRYARALTGSQASGDSYVAAVLETLIASPDTLRAAGANARLVLYGTLASLWGSIPLNAGADKAAPRWEASAQDRLAAIPGKARQVFLLRAVEGFSEAETAEIMHMSAEEVREAYDEANQQISEMLIAEVMIIEDEPLIAMDIEDIVTSLGHSVTGIARTHKEALALAAEHPPELVLSDVHLADGSSGIDAANDILKSFDVPVIFITAFPERLLTGERPEPAFLVTKPFSPEMVKAYVAQALFFGRASREAA